MFDRAGWKMPEEYLYLWDTSTTFYPRDGKMTFEPMEENFKDGVRGMIQWYEEGILTLRSLPEAHPAETLF